MGVTIKEIAQLCGVSAGTVDRALNDRLGINPKTKHKILEVAKALNYQPDHTARSLAKGKTMTLGVVLFDLYNRSFSQLMNAIEVRSKEFGYFVHPVLTDKDPNDEKMLLQHLISRKVDGIILFSVNKGEKFNDYLQSLNIPLVTICNRISDDWSYVGINDRQAMKDAVYHVVGRGYRRIVYICPPLAYKGLSNIYTQEERVNGLMEGIAETRVSIGTEIITAKDYIGALDQIELIGEEKTAILCSCDNYALEVMNYLKSKKYHIPQDVGLMGFDNIDVLKYVTPQLTTVEYAIEEIGIKAVDCLIDRIESGSYSPVPLIGHRLIFGESI